ncbi:hypothetical protein AADEFJLK_04697 [Methylovulum psychrotolerans]|uniref:Uncharacterized protein n=1 Tax=Methylovulum psychrotolerans TaxID=1704499 RepID=A0A2S5CFF3_9GAMM|nr:hypothetical protein AADEFJLK_04697 [Methylovulum psychrotolerans]
MCSKNSEVPQDKPFFWLIDPKIGKFATEPLSPVYSETSGFGLMTGLGFSGRSVYIAIFFNILCVVMSGSNKWLPDLLPPTVDFYPLKSTVLRAGGACPTHLVAGQITTKSALVKVKFTPKMAICTAAPAPVPSAS